MPCDTVITSTCEFLSTSTDVHLLAEGLRSLGYQVRETEQGLQFTNGTLSGTYDKRTGRLQSAGRYDTLDTAEVKRAYSEQVVNSQAKKFGWKISWKTNTAGEREAEVEKRA